MNPKISIITISFNSEKTIEETIKSVISQDYENFEYLIIDGASTDDTMGVVNRYRDYISYVISEPDKGISDAFNKGIKAATGDVIGIINSDDLLMPGALKAIANNYDPEIDVYRGDMYLSNLKTLEKTRLSPTMKMDFLTPNITVNHPSTFISSNAYKRYGLYRVDFKYIMDVDILTRMYRSGAKHKYIETPLAIFFTGGVTFNTPIAKFAKEYKRFVHSNGGSNFVLCFGLFKIYSIYVIKKVLTRLNILNWCRRSIYGKSEK